MNSYSSVMAVQQPDGFYRIPQSADARGMRIWCSDPFNVEFTEDDDRLIMNVTFKTATRGDAVFDWDFISLKYLSLPGVLRETLLTHGVRVAPEPEATYAILKAIQKPDLYINDKKHDEH